MRRTIAAIIAGFVGWAVIVTAIDWALRFWLPGYREAEPTLVFTFTMKIARLTMAALTSLGAGAIVRAIAPKSRLAPWIVGLAIVALFLPTHIHLWHRFPIWYHLSFLLPLAPLMVLGGWLVARQRGGVSQRREGKASRTEVIS
ncbi:MAG TPA: hypothetical protein VMD06_12755 [Steroidobacteraceae bacterium]|nr:hypothetical protein [Steroidobacteraceae bacterium]